MGSDQVRLFLCGDVMLGRGVDQILPHPGDPALRERYVHDARSYVALAEAVSGPIPHRVDFAYPWGVALGALDAAAPDIRVVNLETAVTTSDAFAPGKAVHYRMHPENLPSLTAVRPDVCVLANNHVLDHGHAGLDDTLALLAKHGVRTVGAGEDAEAAARPATVDLPGGGRLVAYALGMASSGIPRAWAATARHGGVHFAAGPGATAARLLLDRIRDTKRPGDLVLVSLHWGSNWGYALSRPDVDYAHALIDAGADLVHGHSSHHARPLEVYRGKLVLYGCGDLINDYEGITGYEQYRDDLRLLYLASVRPDDGGLQEVRIIPLRARRMRLEYAPGRDARWLHDVLGRTSRPYGTRVDLDEDGTLVARPV
ncbi:CapA family protein [Streptomyces sp. P9(2023)]|uniref:CapA family protein n=1 Tax=Streptomyces sp. P9(2023) TaxID=3064394 RepID=UPI0028F406AA|nr:CapA family protein [Streptomyces sp. P9(2023)]MDT9689018.1 CapA family protein [Streptomyces sp. P9(2023)]